MFPLELVDRAFQRTFSRLFVYTLLFEDSEVDEQFLGLDEASSVLAISGAGCRVAGHLSQHPRRIDAVDINPFHLSLTALKVAAAQRLSSYVTFYDLFGRGWHPDPERIVQKLSAQLPPWMQKHWRRQHGVFTRSLYGQGLTSRLLTELRRRAGIDESYLRWLARLPVEERQRAVTELFAPILRRPEVRWVMKSPLNLLALGVNYAQRDRMLETEKLDIMGFFLEHLRRVMTTDLTRNWFAWYAVAGHFSLEDAEGAPPYLRRDRHERSLRSPTEVSYHRRDVFDVLAEAGPRTWSHYTFCDAPDWMSSVDQRRLLEEVLRTSRDGGVLMYRSVEVGSLVERHGLDKRLRPMVAESEQATRLDRTRQYRSVNYYRICH